MNNSPKHLLLILLGRTPQILTESLYALMIQQKIPISEIRAITTEEGHQIVTEHLLNPESSKYFRFCRDYHIDTSKIKFDKDCVIVVQDQNRKVTDLKKIEDCEPFIKMIIEEFQTLTKDPNIILHCVLAGGRKTMSVYFAFVLQFFGRLQDKLYHIMVFPRQFENHIGFFYPPPKPQSFVTLKNEEISTAEAEICLIEVPYVHLRSKMSYLFGDHQLSFTDMVRITQTELEQLPNLPQLIVDTKHKLLIIGSQRIQLTAIEMAFYRYYAERSKARDDSVSVKDYEQYFEYAEGGNFFSEQGLKRAMEIYREIAPVGMVQRFESSLVNGILEFKRMLEYSSRIKRKIINSLGEKIDTDYYIISAIGRYGKCYGIKLDKSKIIIKG